MQNHSEYYRGNTNYSDFLENQDKRSFQKYLDKVCEYVSHQEQFLDVGCGTGTVVDSLVRQSRVASGIEISDTSLAIARQKQGTFALFDGLHIPFADETFSGVGSFNVLEHTEDPVTFLNECVRVTRAGGYVFICTPNFLSLTNSYHYRVAGITRKIKNLGLIASKIYKLYTATEISFDKMATVQRAQFQPDDDAINVTNAFDIQLWGKLSKLTLVYFVGSTVYDSGIKVRLSENPFTKYIMGSVFMIFRKP